MMMMLGIAEGGYRRCRRDIWKTNSQHEGGSASDGRKPGTCRMIDRWHDMAVSRKAAPSLDDEDRLDHFKTLFTLSTGIRNWLHGPGGTSNVVEKP